MDLFFGDHATAQMAARGITREMAASVVAAPSRTEPDFRSKMRYFGVAEGRAIIVVVAYDMNPPFVVTVMQDWSTE